MLALLLKGPRASAFVSVSIRRSFLQRGRTSFSSWWSNAPAVTPVTRTPPLAAALSTAAATTLDESIPRNQTTTEDDDQGFVVTQEHGGGNTTDDNNDAILSTARSLSDDVISSQPLFHPDRDFNMTYPKALSPSAINEFLNCPQSFLFQYIYGMRQPTSLALAKGSFCHEALEQVFDLDASDRTLEHLQNLFRKAWSQQRQGDQYGKLFCNDDGNWDLEAETAWGREALQLLENYVHYEDPRQVARPNPVQREVWVKAQLSLDPLQGSTGYVVPSRPDSVASPNTLPNDEKFLVRGIVDRLDMVRNREDGSIVMRLTDYKTGKAPDLKYSPAMNDKIVAQNFFQLQIYALLLREKQSNRQHSMDLRYLRLLYLTSVQGPAVAWDYDLGATATQRDAVLQDVHAKLSQVWMDILQLVSQQDARLWHGCDRSFCYCHKCRPKFEPGTVWEPPSLD